MNESSEKIPILSPEPNSECGTVSYTVSKDDKSVATDPQPSSSLFRKEDAGITFSPPVYLQRYRSVLDTLEDPRWKDRIHKVVDMGCAEISFFVNLKQVNGIREILEVDIDTPTLERFAVKTAPLTTDYLRHREEDLVVKVLAGSVAEYDKRLDSSDAVICIELIEHLFPPELDALPYIIFGRIKPKVAIFTTPNGDFNVLFPNFGSGFRHPDHKFEWNREQFQDWATNLTERYPDYCVEFHGIGAGPGDTEKTLGCCSQMAVMWRTTEDISSPPLSPPHKMLKESEYKLIRESVYPAQRDERSPELRAQHAAQLELFYMSSKPQYLDENTDEIFIPLSELFERVNGHFSSEEKLKECLLSVGRTFKMIPGKGTFVRYLNRETSSEEGSEHEEDIEPIELWAPNSPKENWDDEDPWLPPNGTEDHSPASPDSDWEMGEAPARPWQSEPQLQASASALQQEDESPPGPLMFRSINEKQIFGMRALASSPEDRVRGVDDSGYPNSASVQDMDVTLGSSDELSNSPDEDQEDEEEEVEENFHVRLPPSPPPPALLPFPPVEIPVNNHDAVNNNRDYEGNDLGREVPNQPRPRPRPPPFPRWLLLLLAEDHDEGFEAGSSSSEEEEDEVEDRHIL